MLIICLVSIKKTNQIKELKYEVLSNLKAKLDDYLTVVWSIMKLFKSQKIV